MALALVISFGVKMRKASGEGLAQRRFVKEDQLGQEFGFAGSYPAFAVCVEVRTAGRQPDSLDPSEGLPWLPRDLS